MDIGTLIFGTLVTGVILFFWGGLTQALTPWGIRAVTPLDEERIRQLSAPLQTYIPTNGMHTVFDQQIAAFIAVRRGSYYNMGRYFALEFLTQVAVGGLLTALLLATGSADLGQRLLTAGLAGMFAAVSVDFQYWNWWGFSAAYTLGFTLNRLMGYALVTVVLSTFVL